MTVKKYALRARKKNSIPHGMTVKERVKIKSARYDTVGK